MEGCFFFKLYGRITFPKIFWEKSALSVILLKYDISMIY